MRSVLRGLVVKGFGILRKVMINLCGMCEDNFFYVWEMCVFVVVC